jgi:hypothetical protein
MKTAVKTFIRAEWKLLTNIVVLSAAYNFGGFNVFGWTGLVLLFSGMFND